MRGVDMLANLGQADTVRGLTTGTPVGGSQGYRLSGGYHARAVIAFDEFSGLRDEWNLLASQSGAFLPFLSFDWFDVWLRHFLNKRELLIVLVYKENKLRAIAPFSARDENHRGIRVRKVELIGNVYSPIRFFLLNGETNEEKKQGLSAVFEFMSHCYRTWDVLDVPALPGENGWFDIVTETVRQRLPHSKYFCYGDWYLDKIECTGAQYIAQLPDKIRKDISYCRRRLEVIGSLRFTLVKDGSDIDSHIDRYYNVYSRSWQKEERIGPSFHRDLAKSAAANGWLRIGFLSLNERPIAAQFWITCNKTAFILKTVYDQDYRKYSPGKILSAEMFRFAIDRDSVRAVDYVQGDETYKQDWTPLRRERTGIAVYNSSLKGHCLNLLENIVVPFANSTPLLRSAKEYIARHLGKRALPTIREGISS